MLVNNMFRGIMIKLSKSYAEVLKCDPRMRDIFLAYDSIKDEDIKVDEVANKKDSKSKEAEEEKERDMFNRVIVKDRVQIFLKS